MVRLVALDLDDTLLTTDKRIAPEDREALKACLEKGIHVVTASGRFNKSQMGFIRKLDLGLEDKPHVGDGGGTIFDARRVIRKMGAFQPGQYEAVLSRTRALDLPCYVTNGEKVYFDIPDQPLRAIYARTQEDRRSYMLGIDDLAEVDKPLKFVFAFQNPEEREKILSIRCPGTITFSAGRNLMEITSAHLNKGSGLKALVDYYGVSMEEVAAFGDSENDIPMLREAGLGLAVANAAEKVKASADAVGEKTNDENGVAWLLEKYIL